MVSPRRKNADDEVIKAWPWFGGTPGKAARKIFAVWVTLLVLLVVGVIYAIVTLQICVAIVIVAMIVVLAMIPTAGLIGSRI